jgi:hypothetical protein
MTDWLVARALARLPYDLRTRYAAEWQADRAALTGLVALRWAFGLQRASAELRRQAGIRRRSGLPLLALDGLALGLVYCGAYLLRFGEDIPNVYEELLVQTLPVVVLGGLVCLAVTANPIKGVGLTTLVLIAYVTMLQPVEVSSAQGLLAVRVPAGVCVLFALSGCALVGFRRAAWQRASTSTRRSSARP